MDKDPRGNQPNEALDEAIDAAAAAAANVNREILKKLLADAMNDAADAGHKRDEKAERGTGPRRRSSNTRKVEAREPEAVEENVEDDADDNDQQQQPPQRPIHRQQRASFRRRRSSAASSKAPDPSTTTGTADEQRKNVKRRTNSVASLDSATTANDSPKSHGRSRRHEQEKPAAVATADAAAGALSSGRHHRPSTRRRCRICQKSSNTPDNPLLRPCACRGTIGYAHERCLLLWMARAESLECAVCHVAIRASKVYDVAAPPPHLAPFGLQLRRAVQRLLSYPRVAVGRVAFVGLTWGLLFPLLCFILWTAIGGVLPHAYQHIVGGGLHALVHVADRDLGHIFDPSDADAEDLLFWDAAAGPAGAARSSSSSTAAVAASAAAGGSSGGWIEYISLRWLFSVLVSAISVALLLGMTTWVAWCNENAPNIPALHVPDLPDDAAMNAEEEEEEEGDEHDDDDDEEFEEYEEYEEYEVTEEEEEEEEQDSSLPPKETPREIIGASNHHHDDDDSNPAATIRPEDDSASEKTKKGENATTDILGQPMANGNREKEEKNTKRASLSSSAAPSPHTTAASSSPRHHHPTDDGHPSNSDNINHPRRRRSSAASSSFMSEQSSTRPSAAAHRYDGPDFRTEAADVNFVIGGRHHNDDRAPPDNNNNNDGFDDMINQQQQQQQQQQEATLLDALGFTGKYAQATIFFIFACAVTTLFAVLVVSPIAFVRLLASAGLAVGDFAIRTVFGSGSVLWHALRLSSGTGGGVYGNSTMMMMPPYEDCLATQLFVTSWPLAAASSTVMEGDASSSANSAALIPVLNVSALVPLLMDGGASCGAREQEGLPSTIHVVVARAAVHIALLLTAAAHTAAPSLRAGLHVIAEGAVLAQRTLPRLFSPLLLQPSTSLQEIEEEGEDNAAASSDADEADTGAPFSGGGGGDGGGFLGDSLATLASLRAFARDVKVSLGLASATTTTSSSSDTSSTTNPTGETVEEELEALLVPALVTDNSTTVSASSSAGVVVVVPAWAISTALWLWVIGLTSGGYEGGDTRRAAAFSAAVPSSAARIPFLRQHTAITPEWGPKEISEQGGQALTGEDNPQRVPSPATVTPLASAGSSSGGLDLFPNSPLLAALQWLSGVAIIGKALLATATRLSPASRPYVVIGLSFFNGILARIVHVGVASAALAFVALTIFLADLLYVPVPPMTRALRVWGAHAVAAFSPSEAEQRVFNTSFAATAVFKNITTSNMTAQRHERQRHQRHINKHLLSSFARPDVYRNADRLRKMRHADHAPSSIVADAAFSVLGGPLDLGLCYGRRGVGAVSRSTSTMPTSHQHSALQRNTNEAQPPTPKAAATHENNNSNSFNSSEARTNMRKGTRLCPIALCPLLADDSAARPVLTAEQAAALLEAAYVEQQQEQQFSSSHADTATSYSFAASSGGSGGGARGPLASVAAALGGGASRVVAALRQWLLIGRGRWLVMAVWPLLDALFGDLLIRSPSASSLLSSQPSSSSSFQIRVDQPSSPSSPSSGGSSSRSILTPALTPLELMATLRTYVSAALAETSYAYTTHAIASAAAYTSSGGGTKVDDDNDEGVLVVEDNTQHRNPLFVDYLYSDTSSPTGGGGVCANLIDLSHCSDEELRAPTPLLSAIIALQQGPAPASAQELPTSANSAAEPSLPALTPMAHGIVSALPAATRYLTLVWLYAVGVLVTRLVVFADLATFALLALFGLGLTLVCSFYILALRRSVHHNTLRWLFPVPVDGSRAEFMLDNPTRSEVPPLVKTLLALSLGIVAVGRVALTAARYLTEITLPTLVGHVAMTLYGSDSLAAYAQLSIASLQNTSLNATSSSSFSLRSVAAGTAQSVAPPQPPLFFRFLMAMREVPVFPLEVHLEHVALVGVFALLFSHIVGNTFLSRLSEQVIEHTTMALHWLAGVFELEHFILDGLWTPLEQQQQQEQQEEDVPLAVRLARMNMGMPPLEPRDDNDNINDDNDLEDLPPWGRDRQQQPPPQAEQPLPLRALATVQHTVTAVLVQPLRTTAQTLECLLRLSLLIIGYWLYTSLCTTLVLAGIGASITAFGAHSIIITELVQHAAVATVSGGGAGGGASSGVAAIITSHGVAVQDIPLHVAALRDGYSTLAPLGWGRSPHTHPRPSSTTASRFPADVVDYRANAFGSLIDDPQHPVSLFEEVDSTATVFAALLYTPPLTVESITTVTNVLALSERILGFRRTTAPATSARRTEEEVPPPFVEASLADHIRWARQTHDKTVSNPSSDDPVLLPPPAPLFIVHTLVDAATTLCAAPTSTPSASASDSFSSSPAAIRAQATLSYLGLPILEKEDEETSVGEAEVVFSLYFYHNHTRLAVRSAQHLCRLVAAATNKASNHRHSDITASYHPYQTQGANTPNTTNASDSNDTTTTSHSSMMLAGTLLVHSPRLHTCLLSHYRSRDQSHNLWRRTDTNPATTTAACAADYAIMGPQEEAPTTTTTTTTSNDENTSASPPAQSQSQLLLLPMISVDNSALTKFMTDAMVLRGEEDAAHEDTQPFDSNGDDSEGGDISRHHRPLPPLPVPLLASPHIESPAVSFLVAPSDSRSHDDRRPRFRSTHALLLTTPAPPSSTPPPSAPPLLSRRFAALRARLHAHLTPLVHLALLVITRGEDRQQQVSETATAPTTTATVSSSEGIAAAPDDTTLPPTTELKDESPPPVVELGTGMPTVFLPLPTTPPRRLLLSVAHARAVLDVEKIMKLSNTSSSSGTSATTANGTTLNGNSTASSTSASFSPSTSISTGGGRFKGAGEGVLFGQFFLVPIALVVYAEFFVMLWQSPTARALRQRLWWAPATLASTLRFLRYVGAIFVIRTLAWLLVLTRYHRAVMVLARWFNPTAATRTATATATATVRHRLHPMLDFDNPVLQAADEQVRDFLLIRSRFYETRCVNTLRMLLVRWRLFVFFGVVIRRRIVHNGTPIYAFAFSTRRNILMPMAEVLILTEVAGPPPTATAALPAEAETEAEGRVQENQEDASQQQQQQQQTFHYHLTSAAFAVSGKGVHTILRRQQDHLTSLMKQREEEVLQQLQQRQQQIDKEKKEREEVGKEKSLPDSRDGDDQKTTSKPPPSSTPLPPAAASVASAHCVRYLPPFESTCLLHHMRKQCLGRLAALHEEQARADERHQRLHKAQREKETGNNGNGEGVKDTDAGSTEAAPTATASSAAAAAAAATTAGAAAAGLAASLNQVLEIQRARDREQCKALLALVDAIYKDRIAATVEAYDGYMTGTQPAEGDDGEGDEGGMAAMDDEAKKARAAVAAAARARFPLPPAASDAVSLDRVSLPQPALLQLGEIMASAANQNNKNTMNHRTKDSSVNAMWAFIVEQLLPTPDEQDNNDNHGDNGAPTTTTTTKSISACCAVLLSRFLRTVPVVFVAVFGFFFVFVVLRRALVPAVGLVEVGVPAILGIIQAAPLLYRKGLLAGLQQILAATPGEAAMGLMPPSFYQQTVGSTSMSRANGKGDDAMVRTAILKALGVGTTAEQIHSSATHAAALVLLCALCAVAIYAYNRHLLADPAFRGETNGRAGGGGGGRSGSRLAAMAASASPLAVEHVHRVHAESIHLSVSMRPVNSDASATTAATNTASTTATRAPPREGEGDDSARRHHHRHRKAPPTLLPYVSVSSSSSAGVSSAASLTSQEALNTIFGRQQLAETILVELQCAQMRPLLPLLQNQNSTSAVSDRAVDVVPWLRKMRLRADASVPVIERCVARPLLRPAWLQGFLDRAEATDDGFFDEPLHGDQHIVSNHIRTRLLDIRCFPSGRFGTASEVKTGVSASANASAATSNSFTSTLQRALVHSYRTVCPVLHWHVALVASMRQVLQLVAYAAVAQILREVLYGLAVVIIGQVVFGSTPTYFAHVFSLNAAATPHTSGLTLIAATPSSAVGRHPVCAGMRRLQTSTSMNTTDKTDTTTTISEGAQPNRLASMHFPVSPATLRQLHWQFLENSIIKGGGGGENGALATTTILGPLLQLVKAMLGRGSETTITAAHPSNATWQSDPSLVVFPVGIENSSSGFSGQDSRQWWWCVSRVAAIPPRVRRSLPPSAALNVNQSTTADPVQSAPPLSLSQRQPSPPHPLPPYFAPQFAVLAALAAMLAAALVGLPAIALAAVIVLHRLWFIFRAVERVVSALTEELADMIMNNMNGIGAFEGVGGAAAVDPFPRGDATFFPENAGQLQNLSEHLARWSPPAALLREEAKKNLLLAAPKRHHISGQPQTASEREPPAVASTGHEDPSGSDIPGGSPMLKISKSRADGRRASVMFEALRNDDDNDQEDQQNRAAARRTTAAEQRGDALPPLGPPIGHPPSALQRGATHQQEEQQQQPQLRQQAPLEAQDLQQPPPPSTLFALWVRARGVIDRLATHEYDAQHCRGVRLHDYEPPVTGNKPTTSRKI